MTKSRLIYCEDGAVGPCEKCGRKLLVLKYRGEFLCRTCLYPDEEPLALEDYMYAPSNFARATAQAPGLHGWPTIHEVRERKERNRVRMREWWSKNKGKGVAIEDHA